MFDTGVHTEQKIAFQLKGSLFTITAIQLLTTDQRAFIEQLESTIARNPTFFKQAPVIFDLQGLTKHNDVVDFGFLNRECRKLGLIPIGIRGGKTIQQKAALTSGLAVFQASKTEDKDTKVKETKSKKTASKLEAPQHKIIKHAIRSGQQIYAKGDLVVLGAVSNGAELLAEGNIHIYGPLRGRALAGVQGDTTAGIFCQSLQAELLSIAGRYQISDEDNILENKKPTQVYLEEDQIQFADI